MVNRDNALMCFFIKHFFFLIVCYFSQEILIDQNTELINIAPATCISFTMPTHTCASHLNQTGS